MDYTALLKTIPLYWNDEGNDYKVSSITHYPDEEMAYIHYGEGSEAEVFVTEIEPRVSLSDLVEFDDSIRDAINTKNKKTYHSHNGFFGDGNSHYWSKNTYLDFENQQVITVKEESYGGQLAEGENVPANVYYVSELTLRDMVLPSKEQEAELLNIIEPIVNAINGAILKGYPSVKIWSDRQFYFLNKRLMKAAKKAHEWGIDTVAGSFTRYDEYSFYFNLAGFEYNLYMNTQKIEFDQKQTLQIFDNIV